jgi:hypothetical protein
MTLLQDRPVDLPIEVAQAATSRAARSVAYAELMGRHPELRDLGTPATVVTDAILWSV